MVTDLEWSQWRVLMPQLARCFSHFLNRAFASLAVVCMCRSPLMSSRRTKLGNDAARGSISPVFSRISAGTKI